ncbi:MAG TPA: hypothetical protein VI259_28085 [Gemmatimonadaceae bacterium]
MRRRMTACSVLAAIAMAAPVCAQQQQAKEKDPTSAVTAAPLPDGWSMRLDDKDATKAAKFETMGSGFHVTSGGAAIYWQPKDEQKDDFTVSATFGQRVKNIGHGDLGEAYGLFVGGRDLSDASKQTYLYFEVRQGGQFLIDHRAGAEVHKIIDWTPAASVHKFEDSPNSNALAIKVAADSVRFLVNGEQVQALPRTALKDLSGNVGIRVNHNLNVHVAGFAVKPGGK